MELNVLSEPLQTCGKDPVTGFTRNGCCDEHPDDDGQHLVCVKLTQKFLNYSRQVGNDLATPRPEFDFPGLRPGDYWCLCAPRWQEALEAGCAPLVRLAATNIKALDECSLEDLKNHAIDLV